MVVRCTGGITAPVAGRVRRIELRAGDLALVGTPIVLLDPLPLSPRERSETEARLRAARAREAQAEQQAQAEAQAEAERLRTEAAELSASETVRRLLDPTLQALRASPSIAWVPLFILWLGIFEASKVALIAIGAVCQWALTMRIAEGLGSDADQPDSWPIHAASSSSGGAPWPR